MTGHVFALAMAALDEVNGPEGPPGEKDTAAAWDQVDWRACEGQVRRLRQRIFKAARECMRRAERLDAAAEQIRRQLR